MKVRYVMLILVLMLLVGAASAWMPDYQYRKSHDISGSAVGTQTNYQMKFVVHRTTGTDSGVDVYVDQKCKADYSDIRFATAATDSVPLDYWIDPSYDSFNAVIWVEVPSIPSAGTTQIYMYYGNSGASSVSNGDATFLLFDNFDASSINASKWIQVGSITVSSGIASVVRSGSDAYIQSIQTFNTNKSVNIRLKSKHFQITTFWEYVSWLGTTGYANTYFAYTNSRGKTFRTSDGTNANYNNIPYWTVDQYHNMQIIRSGSSLESCIIDGASPLVNTPYISSGSGSILFYAGATDGSEIDIDKIFVCNYISPEPTQSTWGPEQSQGSPPIAAFHSNYTISGPAPLSVHFYDDSTSGITNWNWYFNVTGMVNPFSADSNLQNPVYTYTTPGTYNVLLNVTNSTGTNWTTKNNYITVTAPASGPYVIPTNSLPYDITPQEVVLRGTNIFELGGDWTDPGNHLYAVNITAPDVVLDGKNHILTGTLDSDSGTYQNAVVVGANNVTVTSLHATGWNSGVMYNYADQGMIENNLVEHSLNPGIFVENSTSVVVRGNTANSNAVGVFFFNVTDGSILDNTANNNQNGIQSVIGHNISVRRNTANNNNGFISPPGNGILIGSTDTFTMSGNTVTGNNMSGIGVSYAYHGTVEGNAVSTNGQAGIFVQMSDDVHLNENQVNHQANGPGIVGSNSTSIIATSNNVSYNRFGINYFNTTGSILSNTVNHNINGGIGGPFCHDIIVRYNTVEENTGGSYPMGISFGNIYSLTLSDNIVARNGAGGIDVQNLNHGTFVNNTVSDNENTGINIHESNDFTIDGNHADHQLNNSGISAANSNLVTVIRNNVRDNLGNGIWYHNVTTGSILDNIAINNSNAGIGGYHSTSINVGNNTANENIGPEWSAGISFSSSDSINVHDNSGYRNGDGGISLDGTSHSFVVNNTASENGQMGISISNSNNILVDNNKVNHQVNGGGISLADSTLLNTTRNNVRDNHGNGIWYHNVTTGYILDNIAVNNSNAGIGGYHSTGINVGNNTANDNIVPEWSSGISFSSSDSINVYDNSGYRNGGQGISLSETSHSSVINNTISQTSQTGVSIYQSADISVTGNRVNLTTNGGGIGVTNSTSITSTGNDVRSNRFGIWYHNVTGISNAVIDNFVENNTEAGIGMMMGTSNVAIRRNAISGNPTGLALMTDLSSILVADNIFNNNNNIGAPSGVTGITWNVPQTAGPNIIGGPYVGGNYWAQPDGNGWSQLNYAGANGFTVDSFDILNDGLNLDLLPLAYPEPPVTITAHFSADPTEGTVTETRPLVVQFKDESNGPIDKWAWDFGDGSTESGKEGPHTYYNIGMYIVNLTVTDTSSGISDSYISGIYVRPEIPEGVPIWPGWNFVSVPKTLEADHDTAGIVFADVIPNTDGKPIWTYNASASPKWKALGRDDKIETLDAYWIYSTRIGPYVPYTYSTDNSPSVPRVKSLGKGWNAIGLGSVYQIPVEQELPTIWENWQVILDFNNANQVYYLPEVKGQTNGWGMMPTQGYWIYMNSEGDLVALTG